MKIQVIVYVLLLIVSCQSGKPAESTMNKQNGQQPEYVPVSRKLYTQLRQPDVRRFQ
jgi:hypothetical protein